MPVRAATSRKDSWVAKAFSAKAVRKSLEKAREPVGGAEERRLLAAARRGDRRALDLVTRRISGSLYRFSRGFCRNPHDAEDVMQDVLAALLSSLSKFRGQSSLSSWAYVVARHSCARRRKRAARQQSLEGEDGRLPELVDPAAETERSAERRELREALEQAIAELPDSLRHVLVLRDVEGLSAADVARELGLGVRAVKSRLHRARAALRDRLAPLVAPELPRVRSSSCPDVAKTLSQFLEGDLDPGRCARLEQHVTACGACSGACASLQAAVGACAAWRETPAPAHIQDAVRAALRQVVHAG